MDTVAPWMDALHEERRLQVNERRLQVNERRLQVNEQQTSFHNEQRTVDAFADGPGVALLGLIFVLFAVFAAIFALCSYCNVGDRVNLMLARRRNSQTTVELPPEVAMSELNDAARAAEAARADDADDPPPLEPAPPSPPPSPPPSESPSPPRPLRNLCLFAIVGFSSSYTFGDLLWANMATFMRCDPAGLDLPDRTAMAGNLATFSVFLLSWVRCRVAARPGFNFYARLVHATIFAVVAAGVVTAFAWRLPFVVPMANGLAASVGALSWAAVIPFTALHFDESLVSALFVGGTIGSLVAGMIGLVQAAAPAFGPLAALLSLAAVQSSAFAAWSLILRKGYGRKPRDRLLGAKPPASDTELSPMPADGGATMQGAPRGWALRPPRWLRRVADVWALALAINTTTWGMAPNISQFSAAHAGCSCDPSHPDVEGTYRLAMSLSYCAMPVGALLSYLVPTTSMRVLLPLSATQLLAFGLIATGAAAAPPMVCSPTARALLVAAVVTMRFSDTYVTAMLYRVCARRFEAEPATQERVVLAFGQLLILGTLTAGLLGFTLVHDGAIACRVGDEVVAGGANASAAAPVLACDDFW